MQEDAGDVRDAGSIPVSGRYTEKEMATHSSRLAWEIPWRGAWQAKSMGLQRLGCLSTHTHMQIYFFTFFSTWECQFKLLVTQDWYPLDYPCPWILFFLFSLFDFYPFWSFHPFSSHVEARKKRRWNPLTSVLLLVTSRACRVGAEVGKRVGGW